MAKILRQDRQSAKGIGRVAHAFAPVFYSATPKPGAAGAEGVSLTRQILNDTQRVMKEVNQIRPLPLYGYGDQAELPMDSLN